MKKPAIALRSGAISFCDLVSLIKCEDNTIAPMRSGGWKVRAIQVDLQRSEAILSFTACDCAPAPKNIVGIKDTTIFTSNMINWFTNLLLTAKLGFAFDPEKEVPHSLTESIQSITNQRKGKNHEIY